MGSASHPLSPWSEEYDIVYIMWQLELAGAS